MGMAASQARLLALQSRTDSQETKDYLIALNKQTLSTQQTELYKEYDQALKSSNNVTQVKYEINDTAEVSKEAMALLKNDNNTTVTDAGMTDARPKDNDLDKKINKDDNTSNTVNAKTAKITENNTTVTNVRTAQKAAKLSATRARAINAYRRFAS